MKKSISIWCFPGGTSLKDAMKQAKDAGFDGIELALNEQGEMALDWDPFKVTDIKLYADSIGLEISSFASGLGWRYPLITRDEAMAKKANDIMQTCLRFAGILEVDCVLSVPGTVNPEMPYDEAYERGITAYKGLSKMAEEYGVIIGVENVWNKFLLSPLEAARFIDEIGHPYVQFFFDAGNVLLFGYPEQWIRILGKRIRKVHIKDFQTGPGVFTTLLNGDVNYPAVTAALKEVGYDGYLVAEVGPINKGFPTYLIEETSRAMDKIVGRG
jgi:L-ribulose-5-phosphate 3-epimerase